MRRLTSLTHTQKKIVDSESKRMQAGRQGGWTLLSRFCTQCEDDWTPLLLLFLSSSSLHPRLNLPAPGLISSLTHTEALLTLRRRQCSPRLLRNNWEERPSLFFFCVFLFFTEERHSENVTVVFSTCFSPRSAPTIFPQIIKCQKCLFLWAPPSAAEPRRAAGTFHPPNKIWFVKCSKVGKEKSI